MLINDFHQSSSDLSIETGGRNRMLLIMSSLLKSAAVTIFVVNQPFIITSYKAALTILETSFPSIVFECLWRNPVDLYSLLVRSAMLFRVG